MAPAKSSSRSALNPKPGAVTPQHALHFPTGAGQKEAWVPTLLGWIVLRWLNFHTRTLLVSLRWKGKNYNLPSAPVVPPQVITCQMWRMPIRLQQHQTQGQYHSLWPMGEGDFSQAMKMPGWRSGIANWEQLAARSRGLPFQHMMSPAHCEHVRDSCPQPEISDMNPSSLSMSEQPQKCTPPLLKCQGRVPGQPQGWMPSPPEYHS